MKVEIRKNNKKTTIFDLNIGQAGKDFNNQIYFRTEASAMVVIPSSGQISVRSRGSLQNMDLDLFVPGDSLIVTF